MSDPSQLRLGVEHEFHLVDRTGASSRRGAELIECVERLAAHRDAEAAMHVAQVGPGMIGLTLRPATAFPVFARRYASALRSTLEAAHWLDLRLFPLAALPGLDAPDFARAGFELAASSGKAGSDPRLATLLRALEPALVALASAHPFVEPRALALDRDLRAEAARAPLDPGAVVRTRSAPIDGNHPSTILALAELLWLAGRRVVGEGIELETKVGLRVLVDDGDRLFLPDADLLLGDLLEAALGDDVLHALLRQYVDSLLEFVSGGATAARMLDSLRTPLGEYQTTGMRLRASFPPGTRALGADEARRFVGYCCDEFERQVGELETLCHELTVKPVAALRGPLGVPPPPVR